MIEIDFTKEMTEEDFKALEEKYTDVKELVFPSTFEHHLDPTSSRMLYVLLREYKPRNCIEFGTSLGGSGRVIVQALLKNGDPFQYIGFENQKSYFKEAKENIIPLAPDNVKMYEDIIDNLDKIPDEIDFAFIDTNWDKEITVWWLENILPKIKSGSIVQIHDCSFREVDGKIEYEGGHFPGIQYIIDLIEQGTFPFKKIFSVWDYEHYRKMQIASSYWRKE